MAVQTRRVILPLKRSLMDWVSEFDKLSLLKDREYTKEYLEAKSMIDCTNKQYNKPLVNLGSQKKTYEEYYKKGYSINEIAELFEVSKQYVDTMTSQDRGIKDINVSVRSAIKTNIEKVVYVRVPEEYGFDKVKDLGYNSNRYILNRKYKEFGGGEIKTSSELRELVVNQVWEDYNEGLTYKELSQKYEKNINTISGYIREKREETTN